MTLDYLFRDYVNESHHLPTGAWSLKKMKRPVNDREETSNLSFNIRLFGVVAGTQESAFESEGTFSGTCNYPKKLYVEKQELKF